MCCVWYYTLDQTGFSALKEAYPGQDCEWGCIHETKTGSWSFRLRTDGVSVAGTQVGCREHSLSLKPSWITNWEKAGHTSNTKDRLNFGNNVCTECGTYFHMSVWFTKCHVSLRMLLFSSYFGKYFLLKNYFNVVAEQNLKKYMSRSLLTKWFYMHYQIHFHV